MPFLTWIDNGRISERLLVKLVQRCTTKILFALTICDSNNEHSKHNLGIYLSSTVYFSILYKRINFGLEAKNSTKLSYFV